VKGKRKWNLASLTPTEMLLLIWMKPGFLPKIKTLDMCFHFHDSQNTLQNHTLLLLPKISNWTKLGYGHVQTGNLITFRCCSNRSLHSIGLTQHFESSLKQNSSLRGYFCNGNICLMSLVLMILSHPDCVRQFTFSTLLAPCCREVDAGRGFIWSSSSL